MKLKNYSAVQREEEQIEDHTTDQVGLYNVNNNRTLLYCGPAQSVLISEVDYMYVCRCIVCEILERSIISE